MDNYRGSWSLFGFLDLFGFKCSGFCGRRDIVSCSGCSVDFVEKLWESLWGKRWENEEKLVGKMWNLLWNNTEWVGFTQF